MPVDAVMDEYIAIRPKFILEEPFGSSSSRNGLAAVTFEARMGTWIPGLSSTKLFDRYNGENYW